MDAVLTALLPAIGTLAQWLVSLLIKKLGPSQQLVSAKAGIAGALFAHKVEMQKRKQSGSASLLMIFCLVLFSLLAFRPAHADPITTNAGKATTIVANIASGGQVSAPIDLGAFTFVGVLMPPAFTGTAITFYTSTSINGPWVPVYNASGPVTYTVAANRYYALSNITDFQGVRYLQVASGTVEAAARALTLSLKTQY